MIGDNYQFATVDMAWGKTIARAVLILGGTDDEYSWGRYDCFIHFGFSIAAVNIWPSIAGQELGDVAELDDFVM